MDLRVRLDELLPAKTAAGFRQALRRLESGEADQLVITNRNQPRAVLITLGSATSNSCSASGRSAKRWRCTSDTQANGGRLLAISCGLRFAVFRL